VSALLHSSNDFREQLATSRIDPHVAVRAGQLYHHALCIRLAKQVRRVAAQLGERDAVKRAESVLGGCKLAWTTPEAAWLAHYELHRHATAKNVERVLCLLELVAGRSQSPPTRITVASSAPWTVQALRIVETELRSKAGLACKLETPVGSNPRTVSLIESSLDLLSGVWPEAMDELQNLIREVVLVAGFGMRSARGYPNLPALTASRRRREGLA
jgi:hypothetical protein